MATDEYIHLNFSRAKMRRFNCYCTMRRRFTTTWIVADLILPLRFGSLALAQNCLVLPQLAVYSDQLNLSSHACVLHGIYFWTARWTREYIIRSTRCHRYWRSNYCWLIFIFRLALLIHFAGDLVTLCGDTLTSLAILLRSGRKNPSQFAHLNSAPRLLTLFLAVPLTRAFTKHMVCTDREPGKDWLTGGVKKTWLVASPAGKQKTAAATAPLSSFVCVCRLGIEVANGYVTHTAIGLTISIRDCCCCSLVMYALSSSGGSQNLLSAIIQSSDAMKSPTTQSFIRQCVMLVGNNNKTTIEPFIEILFWRKFIFSKHGCGWFIEELLMLVTIFKK